MPVFQDWTYVHNLLGVFPLQTYAYNISSFGPRSKMAGRRGANNQVSYRDGTLWTPKDYEENELDLQMWVLGVDPTTGAVPTDPKAKFWENLEALRRMFITDQVMGRIHKFHPTKLDDLAEPLEIFANVEIRDVIDFTTMAGATRGVFVVRMVLPEVWFKTLGLLGDAASVVRANAATWTVTVDSDVFLKDPIITLTASGGSAANIRIFNDSLGATHWVVYNGVIDVGQSVNIDVGAYTATLTPGPTRVTGAIDWSGQPQMFWLKPGANNLRIETSAPVGVQVQARGKYW